MSRGYSKWFQGSDGGPTGPNCVIHGLLGCSTHPCGEGLVLILIKANSANNDQSEGLRQPTMSKLNRMETMMKMMLVIRAKRRKMAAKPFKNRTNV